VGGLRTGTRTVAEKPLPVAVIHERVPPFPYTAACFITELNLATAAPDMDGDQVGDACSYPDDVSLGDRRALYALLSDAEQARWLYLGEIDKRKLTYSSNTFWFEDDPDHWPDGQRFVVLHRDAIVDPNAPDDVWRISAGTVRVVAEGQGASLTCPAPEMTLTIA
jgi:hypothetical protein